MPARDVSWAAGLGLAAVLGIWLRLHGLGGQVVQDDEWHAIHKLMTAGYGEIFRPSDTPTTRFRSRCSTRRWPRRWDSTGQHAHPAGHRGNHADTRCRRDHLGREPQPRGDAALRVLVSGAPSWSSIRAPPGLCDHHAAHGRGARLWQWRERRTWRLGAAICAMTALSAWLHPITAVFPRWP